MAKRGRPRGATKPFVSDPDRFIIAMIDGLLTKYPSNTFEHAAMFALYFHTGFKVKPQKGDPLQHVRRLALSSQVVAALRTGFQLQSWDPPQFLADEIDMDGLDRVGHAVDRIRKKVARTQTDPQAVRWRYYMRLAWLFMLTGEAISATIDVVRQVGEEEYLRTFLFPRFEYAFGKPRA